MSDPEVRPCVGDYVTDFNERLFHVGRLDTDTEGLILLTNDGDLAHRMTHPSFGVTKTYVAEVSGPIARDLGKLLRKGVELDDGVAKVDRFRLLDSAHGRALVEVTIHEGDTLATMANYYDVSVEAIAYANGIADARALQLGQKLVIPPAEGALYTVKDGDTVDTIATHFKVEPSVVLTYNRCVFEPEQCAPGQKIFVRGAELPALLEPERPTRDVFAAAPQVAQQARNGRLSWPVGGVITQYFWWGHTGVDVAAPYGTGLGAGDDGVVTATGWVAVGGLRVCVQHAGDLTVCYYHTSAVYVSVGQQVARGQIIAAIGLTGVTTGPHVHWECKVGNQFVSCLSL